MIIFIKHIDIEGPGTLGQYCIDHGFQTRIVDVLSGDALPSDWDQITAIVSLGGPMNVYEEDQYPALKNENTFIQEVIRRQIPFLGLCLGSQLLAKAAGAHIVLSPQKEVGWYRIRLHQDPLFEGVDPNLEVFHWHEDMFALPLGATLIATADGCPHQAFRLGPVAYGLQFHIEITDKSITEWSQSYAADQIEQRTIMLQRYHDIEAYYLKEAYIIYDNFFKIIKHHYESRFSTN